MLALALIAQTDLTATLPRRFAAMHAARFGVTSSEAPLPLSLFRIRAIAPRVAMMDAGLAWLFDALGWKRYFAFMSFAILATIFAKSTSTRLARAMIVTSSSM